MLTAHHCFSSQASASTLEAYFDYKTYTCNGGGPALSSVPRVDGATLLATSDASDFTFVQLSANPDGTNYYLGWDSTLPDANTTLHRISHPLGTRQKYSAGTHKATGGIVCSGLPRPDFLYTQATAGSTTGGSSGAPVIKDANGGQIVGQLYGTCYYPSWDECTYSSFNWVDGAFATTFPYISAWLAPTVDVIFEDGFEDGTTSAWSQHGPVITSTSPEPVPGYDGQQPLQIYGSDFVEGCTVTLVDVTNGGTFPGKPTTFYSSGHVSISANFTNATATWTAQVVNPGGSSSNEFVFHVQATEPTPVITSTSPEPVPGYNGQQPLHIYGSDFVEGCTVTLVDVTNGGTFPGKPTTFYSSGHVSISANFTNATATWTAQVVNPAGSSSNTFVFHVQATK